MRFRHVLLGFAAVLAATLGCAKAQPVIDHAWSRATPGQAANGVVYLTITSPSDDELIGASSEVAHSVEVHDSRMTDGVVQMRPVPELHIPSGKPVRLAPGSYHAMLIGLIKPLRAGEHFPLTLLFRHAGRVTVDVTVERIGASEPAMTMGNGVH